MDTTDRYCWRFNLYLQAFQIDRKAMIAFEYVGTLYLKYVCEMTALVYILYFSLPSFAAITSRMHLLIVKVLGVHIPQEYTVIQNVF